MADLKKKLDTKPDYLPRIGITMGDPAGIGPEITLKALADEGLDKDCRPIVIGDLPYLRKTSEKLGLKLTLVEIGRETGTNEIAVYDLKNLPGDIAVGEESAICGKASAEYVEKAIEIWREGLIDAIATAPISKKAISLGGYDFPGHTEFLAELTGAKKVAMSFFAGDLRVVLLSTHVSLREAINLVKKDRLVDLIAFAAPELTKLLGRKVKIGVAGLNPHASEGGMFGREERDEIIPAIAECREKFGLEVSGPYSPDTVFLRANHGEFDAVIALYHDQATIPVKSISFGSSVNVTLGLPLVRTSVDHGTAFDIAGKGVAEASSMVAAVKLAADLASQKKAVV